MKGRGMKPLRSRNGFTLIETLVAMVILAMTLGALYQATAGATRNVRIDEHYNYAILLAESLLAENRRPPAGGVSDSGEVQGYQWRVQSRAYPGGDDEQLPGLELHRLEVEVIWDDGGDERDILLTTVIPVQPDAS